MTMPANVRTGFVGELHNRGFDVIYANLNLYIYNTNFISLVSA